MQTNDSLLVLEDGAAARTSTASGTGIACNLRKYRAAIIGVDVSECDATTGNETYVLSVEVSDVVGGTYTEVARVTVPRGVTGQFEMAVTGVGVEKLDADCAFTRVTWTLGGTTPIITFKAFVRPVT